MLKRIWRRRTGSEAPNKPEPERETGPSVQASRAAAGNPLARGLDATLAALRAAGLARGAARLPWYVLIGEPGAGKTSLLRHGGLRFAQPPAGILAANGPTRDANWWLAEEAVFIDPAGRYTCQADPDTDEGEDWRELLRQLRRKRGTPALNGVIVTVGLEAFTRQTPTERAAQAAAIRRRLQELNSHLCLDLPVYLLFTRLDRFPGFSEFFADLDETGRAQPWGVALPLPGADRAAPLAAFPAACTDLLQRAEQRQLHRLHGEPSLARRRRLHGFPRRLLGLVDELQAFLEGVFSPTRYEQGALLRGVYFLSTEPACFVRDLLAERLPAEQALAAEAPARRRRRKQLQRLAFAGMAALFLTALAGVSLVYQRNSAWLADVESAVDAYRQLPAADAEASDWAALSRSLERLRTLPGGYAQGLEHQAPPAGLGLNQGEQLAPAALGAYRRGLRHQLLPALSRAMAARLRDENLDEDALYETLRHYLMLHQPRHRDPESLLSWAGEWWAGRLPGEAREEQAEALQAHLAAALEQALELAPPDARAIALARAGLAQTTLERRVYRRLKQDYLRAHPQPFSIQSVLGPRAEELFTRRSGTSLAQGVPAFYSYEAFHGGFQLQSRQLARKLAEERWIYGEGSAAEDPDEVDGESLARRVQALYYRDYIAHWRAFLDDLRLRGYRGAELGSRRYAQLAGGDEPLRQVLLRIRRHTALDQLPEAAGELAVGAARGVAERLPGKAGALAGALPAKLPAELPGAPVAHAFAAFNRWTDPTPGATLSELQQSLLAAADQLSSLARAAEPGELALRALAGNGGTAQQGLAGLMRRAPAPISTWLAPLQADTAALTRGLARARLNALWQTEVLEPFRRAVADRYPLRADAARELSLRDFAAFFGPGGSLEQYYRRHLQPLVRSRGGALQWRIASGIPAETLAVFQRAQAVRRAYFDAAGAPRAAFTLRPRRLEKAALGVSLEHGEQRLEYRHGPRRAQRLQWPADSGAETRLVFQLASRTLPLSARTDGDWGWFRLLERHGRLRPEAGAYLLALSLDGVEAQFELRPEGPGAAGLQLLRGFALPERL